MKKMPQTNIGVPAGGKTWTPKQAKNPLFEFFSLLGVFRP
jgi:hypothetical protein